MSLYILDFLINSHKNIKEEYGIESLDFKQDDDAEEENTKILRDYMEKSFTKLGELPHYVDIMKKCTTTVFTIPKNNIKESIYLHCSKNLVRIS